MKITTKMPSAAVQLLLAAATAAAVFPPVVYSGVHHPVVPQLHYVSTVPMVAMPVIDPSRSTRSLPCPSQGFFPHPTNCSRFYRCVDYVGTGQYFSPYEFQCPAGQRFVAVGKNTCVPGDCTDGVAGGGSVPPVGPQSDAYPVDPPNTVHIPPGDDPNAWVGSAADDPATLPPAGGAYPQPGQTGPPAPGGGSTPPSPVQSGTDTYPQPSGSGVSGGSGAAAGGVYPQEGAGAESGAGTGGVAGGAYPQPGVGAGSGTSAGTGGAYPQPGVGAGSGTSAGTGGAYPQPGVGAGSGTSTGTGGAYPQPGVGAGSGTSAGTGGAYPQPGGGTGPQGAGSATGPGAAGGAGTSPGSGTIPAAGGAYPQPGSGGGAPSAGSGVQPGAGGAYPGAQPGGACPARYVQHAQYCNVYEPCPTEGVQYICVTLNDQPLVFDQARQMCAHRSEQEDVCNGKPMMESLFRTDISLLDPSAPLHQLSVPVFIQGQETPSTYQASGVPYVFQQQQPFPFVAQEASVPIFYQGQKIASSQPNYVVESSGSSDFGTAFISRPNSFIGHQFVGR